MLLHSILWTVSYFVVILYYIYLIVFTFIFILFIFILYLYFFFVFFFSSRRRHTRWTGDWSSDVCSSDLAEGTPHFSPRVWTITLDRSMASDQINLPCLSLFCFYPLKGHSAERLTAFQANSLGSWRDQPAERAHPLRSEERRVGKE